MGRPLKNVDESMVEHLASIGCTVDEIAAVVKCSRDTIDRHYAEMIKKGKERMKASLRRRQYEVGMGHPARYDEKGNQLEVELQPDKGMLIWLGKQYLQQADAVNEYIGDAAAPGPDPRNMTEKQIIAEIDKILGKNGKNGQDKAVSKEQGKIGNPEP